jgi:Leucine-rich repeat (LRR) protein
MIKKIVLTFIFTVAILSGHSQKIYEYFDNFDNDSTFSFEVGKIKNPLYVKSLIIFPNNFRELPDDFSKFRNLEYLIIWGNKNMEYEKLFHQLSKLKKFKALELDNNKFVHIPQSLSALTSLKYLDISSSELSDIDTNVISKLTNLESLELSGSSRIDWRSTLISISKLPNLVFLGLPSNSFWEVPSEVSNCKQIKQLNLSGNQLETIPSSLVGLKNLERIYLPYNHIKNIPIEYASSNLQFLDLRNNDIYQKQYLKIKELIPNIIITHKKDIEITALEYYQMGVDAFDKKYYSLANNLFDVSAELLPNADTYFNNAVASNLLKNQNKYCDNLLRASELRDIESTKMFLKDCSQIDSSFYDKNMISTSREASYYKKVTQKFNYEKPTRYTVYIRDKGAEVFSSYELKNNDTIYNTCKLISPPVFGKEGDQLSQFIQENAVYPKKEQKARVGDIVYFEFLIDETGTISDIKLLKPTNRELYLEAYRVISLLDKWTPAKLNGRPVKFKYILPLKFKIL